MRREQTVKKKCWSRSFGYYGAKVRISELRPGGILYLLWVDARGKQRKKSLGHRDKKRGMEEALECANQLSQHREDVEAARLTMGRLFDIYLEHGMVDCGDQYRREAITKLQRWVDFLGHDSSVESLAPSDVRRFAAARQADAKSRGGRALSQTTLWHDFVALNTALNFAVTFRDAKERRLLKANPLAGVTVAKTVSPSQPVANVELYAKVRRVAGEIGSQFELALDLAHATGHRIGAILRLRWEDISLDPEPNAPFGSIHWREEHDKVGNDHVLPIDSLASAALSRARSALSPVSNSGWVFPSLSSDDAPLDRRLASRWLRRALKLAAVPPRRGLGWHAFRRGWATARKNLPDADVAAAGGWKDEATMKRCYQHADAAGILRVVTAMDRQVSGEVIPRLIRSA